MKIYDFFYKVWSEVKPENLTFISEFLFERSKKGVDKNFRLPIDFFLHGKRSKEEIQRARVLIAAKEARDEHNRRVLEKYKKGPYGPQGA